MPRNDSGFSIQWKEYDLQLPYVDETLFDILRKQKFYSGNFFRTPKFNFFEEFVGEIIILVILAVILFIFFLIDIENANMARLFIFLFIGGLLILIGFIKSIINYFKATSRYKINLLKLTSFIKESDDYNSFCNKAQWVDNRYSSKITKFTFEK